MERKRILIAAKKNPSIEELGTSLNDNGYDVTFVENGSEALTLSRELRPHLLLADIELPQVDGHHLLREIKSQASTKNTSVVILSKHRSVEERVHSINLGCDDYIPIPFELDEIMLRLAIILKEIEVYDALPRHDGKGFSGRLDEMALLDIVQTLHVGKKSAVITIHSNHQEGVVYLKDGMLIDAAHEDIQARRAAFRMFCWTDGMFRVELRERMEQITTLNEPTLELLRLGLVYRDRWLRLCHYLPPLQSYIALVDETETIRISQDEKKLLSRINKRSRILDIIENSKSDELKVLSILVKLYRRGIIFEADEKTIRSENSNGALSKNVPIDTIFDNFVTKNGNSKKRFIEKRRSERRKGAERRLRPRRWSDLVSQENSVHLNKSELLMIREKVNNGKLHEPHLEDILNIK